MGEECAVQTSSGSETSLYLVESLGYREGLVVRGRQTHTTLLLSVLSPPGQKRTTRRPHHTPVPRRAQREVDISPTDSTTDVGCLRVRLPRPSSTVTVSVRIG